MQLILLTSLKGKKSFRKSSNDLESMCVCAYLCILIVKIFNRTSFFGLNLVAMSVLRFWLNCFIFLHCQCSLVLKSALFQMTGFDVPPVVIALMLSWPFHLGVAGSGMVMHLPAAVRWQCCWHRLNLLKSAPGAGDQQGSCASFRLLA